MDQQVDLSKLSTEEKLAFLDHIEELERREKEAAANYAPNAGQLPVHASRSQIRIVTAGNGGGKTALASNEAIWACRGFNPVTKIKSMVPARVIVLLDHPEKVTDLWLPELTKWHHFEPEQLNKRGKPYISQITFKNGSEILFMFHNADPLMFESIEYDMLIIDEPCPRPVWIALRRGGRKKDTVPRFLMVGTPITGSWLRKEIIEPSQKGDLKDVEVFKFGTKVNEHNLADGYINEYGALLSEKERKIRLEGEFYDLDGLALSHLFDRSVHLIEPFNWNPEHPCVVAIDPHAAKPHHAILLGVDDEGFLYYIRELKEKSTARKFAQSLREWYRGYKVVDVICDSLGSSEHTGGEGFKSFIQILHEEGVRVRSTTWDDKSDEDFINRIQDSLRIPDEANNFGERIPKLRIFKNCLGITSDIENVSWLKHRDVDAYKPKLDITNKDFLSCLKYALATNLKPGKGKASIYRPSTLPTTYVGKKPEVLRFGFRRRPASKRLPGR